MSARDIRATLDFRYLARIAEHSLDIRSTGLVRLARFGFKESEIRRIGDFDLDRIVALLGPALTCLVELFALADVAVAVPDHRETIVCYERVVAALRLEDVDT